ncbi:DotU family type IV/VI secretion system protein [Dongshaea marina]|uniref:DotU family type IV/VI secretion system protein n=1 Tax=Dongshaea marina TaxID=2047966 RepID=UPI000D3E5024|nr:DotU family type IV/VI secretion system protein [Dongshaea marina]
MVLSEICLLNKAFKLVDLSSTLSDFSLQARDSDVSDSYILNFRSHARNELQLMQAFLISSYSKKVSDLIIFLIVAIIDERCKIFITQNNLQARWDGLQSEFFQRSDGGEHVFAILDEICGNNMYPKIIYEVSLYILESGFLGKFFDCPNHSDRYQYLCKAKESLRHMSEGNTENSEELSFYSKKEIKGRKVGRAYYSLICVFLIVPLITYSLWYLV